MPEDLLKNGFQGKWFWNGGWGWGVAAKCQGMWLRNIDMTKLTYTVWRSALTDSDGMSVWPSTVAMLVLTQHCLTLRSVMVLTPCSVTLNSYHDGANMKLCDPVGRWQCWHDSLTLNSHCDGAGMTMCGLEQSQWWHRLCDLEQERTWQCDCEQWQCRHDTVWPWTVTDSKDITQCDPEQSVMVQT